MDVKNVRKMMILLQRKEPMLKKEKKMTLEMRTFIITVIIWK